MRIPLAVSIENRSETTDKDGRMVNAFEEDKKVVKRPGLVSRYTLTTGQAGATVGQLLMSFSTPSAPGISGTTTLIAIRGDAITRPVT